MTDVEEWYENLPQEEVNQQLEELQQQEFNPHTAEQFVELAQDFDKGSVEHQMLKAGVDISFGKATLQQAMESLIETYGEAATVAAYFKLNSMN